MYEGMINIDFQIMDLEARLEKLEHKSQGRFNLLEIQAVKQELLKKKARAEILHMRQPYTEYGTNPTEAQWVGSAFESEVLALLQPNYPTIRLSLPNTRGLDLIGDDIHVEVKAQSCKIDAMVVSHLYHSSKEWSIDHNLPEVDTRLIVSFKGFTPPAIRRARDLNVKLCTADELRNDGL